ncbi:unnamed protein product [Nippostrongylus brasiliensis]|uniref:PKcGMP_CC domain-containing protein n=1 Tax=Nippostrongylus brasiliensis TaxID=27835 RepID=A0A0N4YGC5_NIPBR|nr:unnamed protein product [Nippostrongylus brasiliensis]
MGSFQTVLIAFYGHTMTGENGVPENSEDESAVDDAGKLPIGTSELEQEIRELEKLLRIEREERRRIQSEAQVGRFSDSARSFLWNLPYKGGARGTVVRGVTDTHTVEPSISTQTNQAFHPFGDG